MLTTLTGTERTTATTTTMVTFQAVSMVLLASMKRAVSVLVTAPSRSHEMAQRTLRSSTVILLDWWRAAWKIFP